ncbi:GNAT family N-acetyltransferase [Pseudomonas typographi]|uniref:GNAT family N-acetyltransferase n=1 Tax=Pseudomonas typographi TaxID=2715964 RepID=UPI00168688C5|nr:GNAT family N-acetyltransferase [Pseudomonas typographi]MBD1549864.1 GNAT family N-acetyltransferase [Pseudomonas typographi]
MLNALRAWRERGWVVIDAAAYTHAWSQYGGSVATHPHVVERLAALAEIPVRYLGWEAEGRVVAALPCWGRHLALSKQVLKRQGRRGLFDLGNAEVILPVAEGTQVPMRQRARYVSQLNATCFTTLTQQRDGLALARAPEDYTKKFRYNQRREQRMLEEAGGVLRPVHDFSAEELADMYAELFFRRWQFAAPGKERLAEVFALLREFMTGFMAEIDSEPVAIQILYKVQAPRWVSLEYVNGGVDPQSRQFSPGSVLSFVNTQSEWEAARALGKPLRYSFGRADREYKGRWCHSVPVYQV